MKDFTETAIRSIQEQVGDKKVILGLSGGVGFIGCRRPY